MFREAIDALSTALSAAVGTPITYRRGAQSASLTAVVGSSTFEIDSGNGIVERFDSRDFIFQASALVLGGGNTLPQRGDTIVDGDYTYAVMPDKGLAPWQYSDRTRTRIRVHTKQVNA